MAVDESLGPRDLASVTAPDAIRLTLPSDGEFVGVARIVVGGLAARHDLSYEHLDDLQLAVESIIGEPSYLAGANVTLELVVALEGIDIVLGPVDGEAVRRALDQPGIGLRTVLGAVVDAFGLEERGGELWLRLVKDASLTRLAQE